MTHCRLCGEQLVFFNSFRQHLECPNCCATCGHSRKYEYKIGSCSVCDDIGGACRDMSKEK